MSVIHLPVRREPQSSHLMLVFVDLQLEYTSVGRPYAIDETAGCLAAAAELLRVARHHRLPIIHVRQVRHEPCFNPATSFADWIEGFRPRPSEAVFERALPSIYANGDFSHFISGMNRPTILLAGLAADRACLASAIDAHSRGHRLVFVEDCSACSSVAGLPESQSLALVTDLIGRFVETTRSDDVIAWLDEPRTSARKRVT